MRLFEAIEEYVQYRDVIGRKTNSERLDLRQMALFLRDKTLSEVDDTDVFGYIKIMKDNGWDVNSLRVKGLHIKKFFEYWQDRGEEVKLKPRLIPIPNREQKLPRVATQEEYLRLLSVIVGHPRRNDPLIARNRAIISLLWDTGARNGEILSMELKDVEKNQATIRTEKNKTYQHRRVFWLDETDKYLREWLSLRGEFSPVCNNVFVVGWNSGSNAGKPMTNKQVAKMFQHYSYKAGMKQAIHPHMFRHHFGRVCAKEGLNNHVISSLLGHKKLESSKIYTDLFGEELQKEYEKVGRVLTGGA